jgi:hypothetical protein
MITILNKMTKTNYLINIILEQNYIQFNDYFYKQHSGLAMGAPTSAIFAETFLQFLERLFIYFYLFIIILIIRNFVQIYVLLIVIVTYNILIIFLLHNNLLTNTDPYCVQCS